MSGNDQERWRRIDGILEAARLLEGAAAQPLVGQRIGPFEVLGALGTGGMGEVYVADGTRLQRRVALKRIPAHLATDPERVLRFRREALATSALNHPNIVTVYEIVAHQGGDLLVTGHRRVVPGRLIGRKNDHEARRARRPEVALVQVLAPASASGPGGQLSIH